MTGLHSAAPTTPWRLAALLHGFATVAAQDDREVSGLALDSRRVQRGALFFACAGTRDHGARYIGQAVAAGAAAIVCDAAEEPPVGVPEGVPLIRVLRLADRIGPIAARFNHLPSHGLEVFGITGTNGKTSCCHYLAQAFAADGSLCGVIGTLGYGIPYGEAGELRPASHTTPDAVTLQAELARMRAAGARRIVMEVSSHALAQGRTLGVDFTGAVFTNLTRDHLDYHGDAAAYGQAKRRLFDSPGLRFAVINGDDAFGREIMASLGNELTCVSYGFGDDVPAGGGKYVRGCIIESSLAGIRLSIDSSWGEGELLTPLVGGFNAGNALAVFAVLMLSGLSLDETLRRIAGLRAVPGRMERFGGDRRRPLVIVDYAHTPDALEQTLGTLRAHAAGHLVCVFGCGGERDRGKRPLMGGIAARLADRVIVTDDNPRGEDAGAIVADILAGMPADVSVAVVSDRAEAIRMAITEADAGDVVLVAGKGHENYQEIGGRRLPFSDREAVAAALETAA